MKDFNKNRSKERLSKNMQTKVRTTMIGAISSIESYFGDLWGDRTTQEQRRMFELFQELRSEILDKGNNQIRNIDSELAQYDIVWNRYRYNIPMQRGN